MKKTMYLFALSVFTAAVFYSCATKLPGMDLVNNLSKLGITSDQAIGGLGSLMAFAKGKLNADGYAMVADAIPGLDNIMNRAEELGVSESDPLATMADVESSFTSLGMDKGMVNKFVPEVVSFVSKNGGQEVGNLLNGVLKQ